MENQTAEAIVALVDEFADNDLESEAADLEAAAAQSDEFDAYAKNGKLGDADDRRVVRIIEEGTLVTLGVMGFRLRTKQGNTQIIGSYEFTAPGECVGEDTNFRSFYGLSPKNFDGENFSSWTISKNEWGRVVAGILQKPLKDPAVNDFLDPAYLAVQSIKDAVEKRQKFWLALCALLNEELKGKTFPTYIGVKEAKGRYSASQMIGSPQYPGCAKYEKRS